MLLKTIYAKFVSFHACSQVSLAVMQKQLYETAQLQRWGVSAQPPRSVGGGFTPGTVGPLAIVSQKLDNGTWRRECAAALWYTPENIREVRRWPRSRHGAAPACVCSAIDVRFLHVAVRWVSEKGGGVESSCSLAQLIIKQQSDRRLKWERGCAIINFWPQRESWVCSCVDFCC